MHSKNILFLCTYNSARSQMAEGFARQIAPPDVGIFSAGIMKHVVHPLAIKVMHSLGIDISHQTSKTIEECGKTDFDLVLTLCDEARDTCPVLPGAPATVHWSLQNPSSFLGNEEAVEEQYLAMALQIKELVHDLFNRGYLAAFIQQKDNMENLLNCLSEGIIAHDLHRKIFFFSRGAEKITGFTQSEVLGKDCREVFSPSLCGENCGFCNENITPSITYDSNHYPTVLLDAHGVRKEMDITVIPMKDQNDIPVGVVASITDITEIKQLKRQVNLAESFAGIIGQDHTMLQIFETIRELAQCDFPVVITGDSGTGKELVARAIHNESSRRDKLFVPINCGALPEGTLESELFGHVKGAFTGAIRDKKGRFELADGGTLFLDEVAELSPAIQVKLLRVLQEGEFEPVGSEKSITVDVRIISATNKNLKEMIRKETFREDLFYRLAVVPIEMPPLRDRRNDIPLLAESFTETIAKKLNREKVTLSKDTITTFISYAWPGNVRQLQNVIQYAMIKCRGNVILPEHLPPEIQDTMPRYVNQNPEDAHKVGRRPKLHEDNVRKALVKAGGNKAKAARMLGVGRATLYNFLNENPQIVVENSPDLL